MHLPCRDLITVTERGKVCRAAGAAGVPPACFCGGSPGLPERRREAVRESLRESRRFRCSRRHALAEQFDGFFESLSLLPEVGPEVALFLEPRKDSFYVVGFRVEVWPQFSGQNRRRNRRLGKCPYRIRSGQRSSMRILLDVD